MKHNTAILLFYVNAVCIWLNVIVLTTGATRHPMLTALCIPFNVLAMYSLRNDV